ncbi:hypothetical protein ES705_32604 [subsurface metagenome]
MELGIAAVKMFSKARTAPSVLGGGMKRFPDSSQCRSGFFSGDGKDSRQVWHDTARCIDA